MILGPKGRKHFDLKYSKLFLFLGGKRTRADQRIFSFPKTELASSLRLQEEAPWLTTWRLQPMHTHPPRTVVDKTFTNSGREKCGHLYCHALKLDISGATRVHESPKEVKIQMDINVQ